MKNQSIKTSNITRSNQTKQIEKNSLSTKASASFLSLKEKGLTSISNEISSNYLVSSPGLHFLDLSENKLKAEAIKKLGPNITSLNLSSNPLQSCFIPFLSKLRILNLDFCNISSFEGFPHFPSLIHLSINHNSISSFKGLPLFPVLEYFSILSNATEFSPEIAIAATGSIVLSSFNQKDVTEDQMKVAFSYSPLVGIALREGMNVQQEESIKDEHEKALHFLTHDIETDFRHLSKDNSLFKLSITKLENSINDCNESSTIRENEYLISIPKILSLENTQVTWDSINWYKNLCPFYNNDTWEIIPSENMDSIKTTLRLHVLKCSLTLGKKTYFLYTEYPIGVNDDSNAFFLPYAINPSIIGAPVEGSLISLIPFPIPLHISWFCDSKEISKNNTSLFLSNDYVGSSITCTLQPYSKHFPSIFFNSIYSSTEKVHPLIPIVAGIVFPECMIQDQKIDFCRNIIPDKEGKSEILIEGANKQSSEWFLLKELSPSSLYYIPTANDIGKYLRMRYKPILADGTAGNITYFYSKSKVLPAIPTFQNVTIAGQLRTNYPLMALGQYSGGQEGQSEIIWYYSPHPIMTKHRTKKLQIVAKNSKYFTPSQDLAKGYIAIQMTPIRVDGVVGDPVFYAAKEPIELYEAPQPLPEGKISKGSEELSFHPDNVIPSQNSSFILIPGMILTFQAPVIFMLSQNTKDISFKKNDENNTFGNEKNSMNVVNEQSKTPSRVTKLESPKKTSLRNGSQTPKALKKDLNYNIGSKTSKNLEYQFRKFDYNIENSEKNNFKTQSNIRLPKNSLSNVKNHKINENENIVIGNEHNDNLSEFENQDYPGFEILKTSSKMTIHERYAGRTLRIVTDLSDFIIGEIIPSPPHIESVDYECPDYVPGNTITLRITHKRVDPDKINIIWVRVTKSNKIPVAVDLLNYEISPLDIGATLYTVITIFDQNGKKNNPYISKPTPIIKNNDIMCPMINGDLIEESILHVISPGKIIETIWFRNDNGKFIQISNNPNYKLSTQDVGHNIRCQVTISNPFEATLITTTKEIVEPCFPYANIFISSNITEGEWIVPEIQYHGGTEGNSEVKWFRENQNNDCEKFYQLIAETRRYKPIKEDVGHKLLFTYCPIRSDKIHGKEVSVECGPVNPSFPSVSNVKISQDKNGNLIAKGKYFGGNEGFSIFIWRCIESNHKTIINNQNQIKIDSLGKNQVINIFKSDITGEKTQNNEENLIDEKIMNDMNQSIRIIAKTKEPMLKFSQKYIDLTMDVIYIPVRNDGTKGSQVVSSNKIIVSPIPIILEALIIAKNGIVTVGNPLRIKIEPPKGSDLAFQWSRLQNQKWIQIENATNIEYYPNNDDINCFLKCTIIAMKKRFKKNVDESEDFFFSEPYEIQTPTPVTSPESLLQIKYSSEIEDKVFTGTLLSTNLSENELSQHRIIWQRKSEHSSEWESVNFEPTYLITANDVECQIRASTDSKSISSPTPTCEYHPIIISIMKNLNKVGKLAFTGKVKKSNTVCNFVATKDNLSMTMKGFPKKISSWNIVSFAAIEKSTNFINIWMDPVSKYLISVTVTDPKFTESVPDSYARDFILCVLQTFKYNKHV